MPDKLNKERNPAGVFRVVRAQALTPRRAPEHLNALRQVVRGTDLPQNLHKRRK